MKKLTCPEHREYKAEREPTVACRYCWYLYLRGLSVHGLGNIHGEMIRG